MEAVAIRIAVDVGVFVQHWCWYKVGAEGGGIRSSRRRKTVKEILKIATKLWSLRPVKEMFISVNQEPFQKYATDALGCVYECKEGLVTNDGHVSLLGAITQSYESYG